jgi:NADPH:quinone reductase-like Zn-dependent oxidoreductase
VKAIVWTAYGSPDVLQLQEVEKPAPKPDEVLIRVFAATVIAGDAGFRSLKLPLVFSLPLRLFLGLSKPKRFTILGQELAGVIEAVGKDVRRFREGDEIFAMTGLRFGAYAEYNCLPEDSVITIKPANMTFEEAAAVPVGGTEALHLLRKATIQRGERVLINGAGGSIGTIAVQLARNYGAEVTAVDSAAKLDMLRSIGADHVIDYMHEDFSRNGQTYDVIIDVIGKSSFSRSLASLNRNGRYILGNPKLVDRFRGPWASWAGSKQVFVGSATAKAEDLVFLRELIEAGQLKVIIDRRYPLAQTAEAHRYVETGQKKGNVIISVSDDRQSDEALPLSV